MKKLWMLAALMLSFTIVGCDDDDDNNGTNDAQFGRIECVVELSASADARTLVVFGGEITGFQGEEVADDTSIAALNYADSNTFDFAIHEDKDVTAMINITGLANESFVAGEGKLNAEFVLDITTTVYDANNEPIVYRSKTASVNKVGLDNTVEGQGVFVRNFPITVPVSVNKVDGTYEISY